MAKHTTVKLPGTVTTAYAYRGHVIYRTDHGTWVVAESYGGERLCPEMEYLELACAAIDGVLDS
jgi:hypothetical protein